MGEGFFDNNLQSALVSSISVSKKTNLELSACPENLIPEASLVARDKVTSQTCKQGKCATGTRYRKSVPGSCKALVSELYRRDLLLIHPAISSHSITSHLWFWFDDRRLHWPSQPWRPCSKPLPHSRHTMLWHMVPSSAPSFTRFASMFSKPCRGSVQIAS